jgi:hypothetical protein
MDVPDRHDDTDRPDDTDLQLDILAACTTVTSTARLAEALERDWYPVSQAVDRLRDNGAFEPVDAGEVHVFKRRDSLVWYVAYGSNLCDHRFACYLKGGRPDGSARTYPGARNTTGPILSVPVIVNHQLRFAGDSTVWGGGVAFLEPTADSGITWGVARLVNHDQLADIVAQENRHDTPGAPLELPTPKTAATVADGGWYDQLIGLEPLAGIQTVTLTGGAHLGERAPSDAYIDTIKNGLAHHWGMTGADAGRYLRRAVAGILA